MTNKMITEVQQVLEYIGLSCCSSHTINNGGGQRSMYDEEIYFYVAPPSEVYNVHALNCLLAYIEVVVGDKVIDLSGNSRCSRKFALEKTTDRTGNPIFVTGAIVFSFDYQLDNEDGSIQRKGLHNLSEHFSHVQLKIYLHPTLDWVEEAQKTKEYIYSRPCCEMLHPEHRGCELAKVFFLGLQWITKGYWQFICSSAKRLVQ